MSYIEIRASLKLSNNCERSPEECLSLCNDLKEEIVALLDRLHKASYIGKSDAFAVNQAPVVEVEVVEVSS